MATIIQYPFPIINPYNTGLTFGNGSDGNLTVTANTTLLRIYQFNNLTINANITLYAPYKIFVNGSLIINHGGVIMNNGGNATGTTDGVFISPPNGQLSGLGGNGTTPAENFGMLGSVGGKTPNNPARYSMNPFLLPLPAMNVCAAGGGQSGIPRTNLSNGGSGSGGNTLIIAARTIVPPTGVATICFTCTGGNGGNTTTPASGGNSGSGGCVCISYQLLVAFDQNLADYCSVAPGTIGDIL